MNETLPGVLERIKAAAIDALVIVLMLIGFSKLYGMFDNVPDLLRGITVGFIFLIYEPLTISLFGATLGHSSMGIQVKQSNDHSKNVSFVMAVVRFTVKIALGWISLITVSTTEDRKGIHDMVVGSTVLYSK
jgi:uncharacterized RDD family membrane protein YckC